MMGWARKIAVVGLAAMLGWFGGNFNNAYQYSVGASKALGPSYLSLDGCSGVHIGNDIVLTAAHCAPAVPSDYERLWISRDYDVLLLRSRGPLERESAPLACRDVRIGEKVVAITYPSLPRAGGGGGLVRPGPYRGEGLVATVDVGWESLWPSGVFVTAAGAPGSSGGAIYAEDGKTLLGIVVGGPVPFGQAMLMVPSSTICDLLAR